MIASYQRLSQASGCDHSEELRCPPSVREVHDIFFYYEIIGAQSSLFQTECRYPYPIVEFLSVLTVVSDCIPRDLGLFRTLRYRLHSRNIRVQGA